MTILSIAGAALLWAWSCRHYYWRGHDAAIRTIAHQALQSRRDGGARRGRTLFGRRPAPLPRRPRR